MQKTSLAIIGISAGLAVTGCQKAGGADEAQNNESHYDQPEQEVQADLSAEKALFYNTLSPEAKKQFDALDFHHQMMAVEMSHQTCNGKNKCAGMGGCKNVNNDCAGKNGCKGQGGPPIKDPNRIVAVQTDRQTNGQ